MTKVEYVDGSTWHGRTGDLEMLLNIKLDLFYSILKRIPRAQLFFLEGQENFSAY
jgi:hypothetical protein